MAIKLSDHVWAADRGDSGRLAAAGAEGVALVGPDGVAWRGSRVALAEWLAAYGGDWVMVEGGRMLPTVKVLLAGDRWPPHRPPVAAGIAQIGGEFPARLSLRLPQEAAAAAAWIDGRRLACSMPANAWRPVLAKAWDDD